MHTKVVSLAGQNKVLVHTKVVSLAGQNKVLVHTTVVFFNKTTSEIHALVDKRTQNKTFFLKHRKCAH